MRIVEVGEEPGLRIDELGVGGGERSRGWRLRLCMGGVVGAREALGIGSGGECGGSWAKVCSTRWPRGA
jgi:hypothetical protein